MSSKPLSKLRESRQDVNRRPRSFRTPNVHPVAAVKYAIEAGRDARDADVAEMAWASELVKNGASLPTSRRRAPFLKTSQSLPLDGIVREMVANSVLIKDRHISAAFPLKESIRDAEDVSYLAVQDFGLLDKNADYHKERSFQNLFLPIQRIAPIDKMIRINLCLGFYQLQLDRKSSKSCGVWYSGQLFSMTRLPPRHPEAQLVMQRWANVVGLVLESKFDVYCVFHLDEWLIYSTNVPVKKILNYLKQDLGVQVDFGKSVLMPCRRLEFYGFIINCKEQSIQLTRDGFSVLERNILQFEHLSWISRERIARYWQWVSYCHRLPLFIEDHLMSGETIMIEQFLKKYPFRVPKLIKRSQRTIDIFVYVQGIKIAALSPEFEQCYRSKVALKTSSDALQAEAAIRGAKWAIETLAPNRVDVGVYLSSSVAACYKPLASGKGQLFRRHGYLVKMLVDLYSKVQSRNLTWYPEKCYKEHTNRPQKETVDFHFRES